MTAYDDVSAFKIYLFDVGILRALSGLDASFSLKTLRCLPSSRVPSMKNAVLLSLVPRTGVTPRYWLSDSGRAEVDFPNSAMDWWRLGDKDCSGLKA